MNEKNLSFAWAESKDANLEEPLEDLKQYGWRYGDVPAASNFNWVFKKISEEFAGIKNEILAQKNEAEKLHALVTTLKSEMHNLNASLKEEFISIKDQLLAQKTALKSEMLSLNSSLNEANAQIKQTNKNLSEQKNELKLQKTAIDKAKKNHESLKTHTFEHLETTFRNDEFNIGIARQMCMFLRDMEKAIRHYHPNFPQYPWPLQDFPAAVRRREEGNESDVGNL